MGLLVKNEFQKILLRKKTMLLFIIFTLIVLGSCLFLNYYGLGNHTSDSPQVKVNNINLPVLVAKESFFVLSLIIFPLLFLDSFSGELSSGAYRMTLIRPISRVKLLFSKYVSQLIIALLFLAIPLLVSYIYGQLLSPHVSHVTYSNQYSKLNGLESVLYTVKFYSLLLIIGISILTIVSLLSAFIPNTPLCFLFTLGVMIGSIYISDTFSYFLLSGEYVYNQLNNQGITFFLTNGIIILCGGLVNSLRWRTKDFF
ncbi:ABC transporter permease [Metabacillus halosaccharovorans]|uniref:ABC transporter permease n=1 Tax=Metabacillus halosaccharovorans TaxID=930124 RepID=UPI001C1FFCC5|nr:ABC transporter permease subunit [Metabacillus halosaccharovorans]MBU7595972.1 ABC transporter permease subunit [Metabacillus halosaccharovorans]